MATEASPQRAWRAACPNCGAPVEFRSAASAFAVCGYCQSTLVREGEALRRTGAAGEVFDDHSPLQLGAAGRHQGLGFLIAGRLQYRTTDGTWNEWHAVFDNGRSGWLSEDNGRHVFAVAAEPPGPLPAAPHLRPGAIEFIGPEAWTVASLTQATLITAQGELPFAPKTDGAFALADLRDSAGRVATIDYADAARPRWFVGLPVELPALALTGLKEASTRTLQGRSFACPSCGAALQTTLETTQALACHQCHAVVDLSAGLGAGIGADLRHYAQETGAAVSHEPALPLGRTGLLRLGGLAAAWQVVGYLERHDEPGDGEESSFWREYLLYNQLQGFAFLVDADDGWSWVRPISGVPERVSAEKVRLDGILYARRYEYDAVTSYVLGEFYWPVTRGQRSRNTDYAGTGSDGRRRLNREDSAQEVIWSRGETIDAAELVRAFKVDGLRQSTAGVAPRADLGPFTAEGGSGAGKMVLVIVVILVLMMMLSRCDEDCDEQRQTFGANSNEYKSCMAGGGSGAWRSTRGSWGGWGGGHK